MWDVKSYRIVLIRISNDFLRCPFGLLKLPKALRSFVWISNDATQISLAQGAATRMYVTDMELRTHKSFSAASPMRIGRSREMQRNGGLTHPSAQDDSVLAHISEPHLRRNSWRLCHTGYLERSDLHAQQRPKTRRWFFKVRTNMWQSGQKDEL